MTTEELPLTYDHNAVDPIDEFDEFEGDPPVPDLAAAPRVHENSGQVATVVHGGMHQHLHQYVRRFLEYHELGAEHVGHTMDTYVERVYRSGDQRSLDSTGTAALFGQYHALVLVGDPGTGRHTAAVALLSRLGLPMREIRPRHDPAQPQELSTVDLPTDPGMAFLLELPGRGEPVGDDFPRQLRSYRDALRAIGSYLVVVVTPETWRVLGGFNDGGVLAVQPPDPRQVLSQELTERGTRVDLTALLNAPPIVELLRHASPREVVRLAGLIVSAAATAVTDGTEPTARVDVVVSAAIAAYHNWDNELADWFHKEKDVRVRLFLLAAAVLEHSPADLVLRAAEDLGNQLGDRPSPTGGIGEAGIRELTARIGARIAVDSTLYFTRPAYAPAVLDFVRSDRSDRFQRQLWAWAAELPMQDRTSTSVAIADRTAAAMLDLVLRHRDPRMLRRTVPRWAVRRDLRSILVELLTAVALSPEAGSWMRQQLNLWAARSSNPAVLITVAEVCQGQLADVYPDIALTRLNHLAGKAVPAVADSVVGAVVSLWSRPQLRRPVLEKTTSWAREQTGPKFDVGCRLLSVLSDPGTEPTANVLRFVIADRPQCWDNFVRAVAGMLDAPAPPEHTRRMLFTWLSLAAEDPTLGEQFIDLMVAVARVDGAPARRIARLRTAAYDWQPVSGEQSVPDRRDLRERLVERLHRADPMTTPSAA
ncbi:hypothetical protein ACNTMW_01345 [Planosporangium sp. 12N6]|uniref:hypothetical protein n=1 Tax=Planosporangium spinosum TaxID=3402278 RepID=UPI003CF878D2